MKRKILIGMFATVLGVLPNFATEGSVTKVTWRGFAAGDSFDKPCKGVCLFKCRTQTITALQEDGGSFVEIRTKDAEGPMLVQTKFCPLKTPTQISHDYLLKYANLDNVEIEVRDYDTANPEWEEDETE